MNAAELSKAIRERADAMRDAGEGQPITHGEMCDNAELLVVLARIVEGRGVARAFGSPGDWGYNHPIGRALALAEDAVPR